MIDPVRVERLRDEFGDLGEHGVDRVYISTIDGDLDEDGDIDQLCVQGGRSFSIIDETSGVTVWNSGAQIELMTGMLFPGLYNAGDERSDRAGPEPEGIAITGTAGEVTERIQALADLGVTDFAAVEFADPANPDEQAATRAAITAAMS